MRSPAARPGRRPRTLLDAGAEVRLPAAFGLGREDVIQALMRDDPDRLKPGQPWGGLIGLASIHSSGQVIERLIARGAAVHVRVDSKPHAQPRRGPRGRGRLVRYLALALGTPQRPG